MFCLILKGEHLESSIVGDMAHKPAYFVPGESHFISFDLQVSPKKFSFNQGIHKLFLDELCSVYTCSVNLD